MKKKFLALVMTLSMVLSLVPMTALATEGNTASAIQEGQSVAADATGNSTESDAATSGSPGEDQNPGGNDTGDSGNSDGDTGNKNPGGTEPAGPSTPDTGSGAEGGNTGTGGTTEGGGTEGGGEIPSTPEASTGAAKIGATKYETIAKAIEAAESSNNTITLLRDVKENITIDKSLTLDLAGFTLSGDGTKTVVSISGKEKDMDVTVKNGTVTGGHATNGGGFDIQRGNIKIENCIIEKNTAKSAGGGVNIGGSANVTITGSEIRNNTAIDSSGGAIYLASSWAYDGYYNCACEIVDTKLNNNSAKSGGALGMGASMYLYQNMHITASFTMSGKSEISSNTATTSLGAYGGGGVYLSGNGSRFIMNDGFITDNVAENSYGGAIFSQNWRGITLNGGSITGNSAKMHGGAIYIANVNLRDNPLEDEVLNIATGVTITDNHCDGNGGGIAALNGVTVKIAKNSALYNNTAKTIGDDVYSGSGNQLNLPEATEMSGDLILSSDNVPITDWYYDGFKDASTRHRWGKEYSDLDIDATKANGVPTLKTGIYYEIFKPVEDFEGTIALKAAHAQLFTLTYNVTGDLPEGYTAPAAQRMLIDSEYTVAEVPASETGTKDGVNGTFTFAGWTDKDGKVLSGEQKLTGDVTLYGVWTFTKKSSSGGHRPSNPPVTIPDDVPTGLNGKDHYAYVVGYPDGMVYPQKNITRAEVATIFFRLLEDETREANMTKSNSYNDMKDGAWYTCAVSTLSKMGIIKGYEDGSFKPDASISRAEFAAIAARFDPDGDKTPATFSDVSSHWAKDEISIAANHGWIKGYEDGSFKPDQKITRAETMTLVNRVLKRLPETKDDLHKDMKTWPDNQNESAWFYLAVQEATNSHYQNLKKDGTHETWESMRETRDWAALEK